MKESEELYKQLIDDAEKMVQEKISRKFKIPCPHTDREREALELNMYLYFEIHYREEIAELIDCVFSQKWEDVAKIAEHLSKKEGECTECEYFNHIVRECTHAFKCNNYELLQRNEG